MDNKFAPKMSTNKKEGSEELKVNFTELDVVYNHKRAAQEARQYSEQMQEYYNNFEMELQDLNAENKKLLDMKETLPKFYSRSFSDHQKIINRIEDIEQELEDFDTSKYSLEDELDELHKNARFAEFLEKTEELALSKLPLETFNLLEKYNAKISFEGKRLVYSLKSSPSNVSVRENGEWAFGNVKEARFDIYIFDKEREEMRSKGEPRVGEFFYFKVTSDKESLFSLFKEVQKLLEENK